MRIALFLNTEATIGSSPVMKYYRNETYSIDPMARFSLANYLLIKAIPFEDIANSMPEYDTIREYLRNHRDAVVKRKEGEEYRYYYYYPRVKYIPSIIIENVSKDDIWTIIDKHGFEKILRFKQDMKTGFLNTIQGGIL